MQVLQHSKHGCVEATTLFSQLNAEQRERVWQKVQYTAYEPGEAVFEMGAEADQLVMIHEGQLKVVHDTFDGREQTLYYLTAGDVDGETCLIAGTQRETSLIAVKPARVCSIKRQDFLALLSEMPSIAIALSLLMSKKMAALQASESSMRSESVTDRLQHYLERTAVAAGSQTFDLPITKKELAALLGTVPATLSRRFAELEERQVIHRGPRGKITLNVAECATQKLASLT